MLRLARGLCVSTSIAPFRDSSKFIAIAARSGNVASPYIVISAGKAPISHLIVLLRVNAWPVAVPAISRVNVPMSVFVVKAVMPPTPALILAVGSGPPRVDDDAQSVVSNVEPVPAAADAVATVTPDAATVNAAESNKATPLVLHPFNFLQPPLDDQRFNQLDELQSQSEPSQSQQDSADNPQSQSVLANVSNVVDDVCEAMFRVPDVPATSSSSAGSPPSQDSDMADPSAARKRDLSPSLDSRPRGRKQSRHPGSHVPSGVASAASLARARSSSGSRSVSRSRSSSFNS